MAYISTKDIDNAINNYRDIKTKITKSNENEDVDEIVNMIDNSISELEGIKRKIDAVNRSIDSAKYEVKKEQENNKENE